MQFFKCVWTRFKVGGEQELPGGKFHISLSFYNIDLFLRKFHLDFNFRFLKLDQVVDIHISTQIVFVVLLFEAGWGESGWLVIVDIIIIVGQLTTGMRQSHGVRCLKQQIQQSTKIMMKK